MKFDEHHIIVDGSLENRDEAIAYVKFLESEALRHLGDVEEIKLRIDVIKGKWGL